MSSSDTTVLANEGSDGVSSTIKEDTIWVERTILQIVVASISFFASLVVVLSVAKKQKHSQKHRVGLSKNAYRRIIFGISIADMLQSFSLSAGVVLLTPNDVPQFARWGIGNQRTCVFDGVLMYTGWHLSQLYIAFLCFYYYCKIKHKIPDDVFKQRFEIKIHLFIFAIVTIFNIAAICLDALNLTTNGTYCAVAPRPAGCQLLPDVVGECDKDNERAIKFVILVSFVITGSSFIVIIFFMAGLLYHVCHVSNIYSKISKRDGRKLESQLRRSEPSIAQMRSSDISIEDEDEHERSFTGVISDPSVAQSRDSDTSMQDEDKHEISSTDRPDDNRNAEEAAEKAETLRKLYLKVSTTQVFLFAGAYILGNFPFFFVSITRNINGNAPGSGNPYLRYFMTICFAGVGIMNILVFTRPAIANLRRLKPDFSWCYSFYLVLLNGGEVPDEAYETENVPIIPHQERSNSIPFGVENAYQYGETKDLVAMGIMSNMAAVHGSDENISESNAAHNPKEKWKYVKGGSPVRRLQSLSRNANESLLAGSFDGFSIESCFDYEEDMDNARINSQDNEHIDSHT
ncbi:hypothetical protein CTEN210_12327 [Chaetoceros tenuissimus]|uniref:G-protein coupled receptors family 1 profile domain-containing protein n=1 Tax=Chaetoceros tenuissimus TaxID=426638 RepID=A0AAD3D307_9STRA|nr:hypothetical protein CTEN210_12327 [Chaetoceros tenuissimus]